jgi:hypothetical protein
MTSFYECITCFGVGTDGLHPCRACKGLGMVEELPEGEDETDYELLDDEESYL